MLDATLVRMDRLLDEWVEAGDHRAVFLDCYTRMTRAMGRELAAGGFDDPVWVEALLDRFAVYYFDALDAWERGDPSTPAPWVIAHETAVRREASPAQLLLAGVNAHINYDLMLTMVDLLEPECATGVAAEIRHHDYDRVNDVIAATADEVQDLVVARYQPWLAGVDVAMGRIDEWLAVRLLSSWRADVWRHAVRLLDEDADRRVEVVARRAAQCERRSRWVLLRM
ncbi:MAG TPA: DUF5995 family protein [Acidimicrobiales bacterium]|nr:DUF5995 family protein [Acidimicrobiales bacterium]